MYKINKQNFFFVRNILIIDKNNAFSLYLYVKNVQNQNLKIKILATKCKGDCTLRPNLLVFRVLF